MTLVQDRDGIEAAREITNREWMIGAALSSTFHGRDIFSPVGAHLAHGEDWTQVGPEVAVNQLVRLDLAPFRAGRTRAQRRSHRHRWTVRQPGHQYQRRRLSQAWLRAWPERPLHRRQDGDEYSVRPDLQRRGFEKAAAVHRLAWPRRPGGEPGKFCGNLCDHAAGPDFHLASQEVDRILSAVSDISKCIACGALWLID